MAATPGRSRPRSVRGASDSGLQVSSCHARRSLTPVASSLTVSLCERERVRLADFGLVRGRETTSYAYYDSRWRPRRVSRGEAWRGMFLLREQYLILFPMVNIRVSCRQHGTL